MELLWRVELQRDFLTMDLSVIYVVGVVDSDRRSYRQGFLSYKAHRLILLFDVEFTATQ